jgi:hypothetical protein
MVLLGIWLTTLVSVLQDGWHHFHKKPRPLSLNTAPLNPRVRDVWLKSRATAKDTSNKCVGNNERTSRASVRVVIWKVRIHRRSAPGMEGVRCVLSMVDVSDTSSTGS